MLSSKLSLTCWLGIGTLGVCLLGCGTSNRSVQEGTGVGGNAGSSAGGASGQAGNAGANGGSAGSSSGSAGMSGASGVGGNGGSSGDAGASGASGTAGASGASGSGGSAGADCNAACTAPKDICENGQCVECAVGSQTCHGNTPSSCVDGSWVDDSSPCSGTLSACTNGVCGAAKLVGGIVTVADGVLTQTPSGVHLVEHGLEYNGVSCGTANGGQVCVSGGIRP